LEGLIQSLVTNLESTTSENEAKKVKLQKEFDRKNKIFEEHLQKLNEQ